MSPSLFTGKLVRLTAEDPQPYAEAVSRWLRDTECWRLQDSFPPRPISRRELKEDMEKNLEKDRPDFIPFSIHTLAENRLIGDIALFFIRWTHGDSFVGIGIQERELWGKGYGTDAMRVILRYAFAELNLHRVSLDVYEYNPRAIRSYEKCGFKLEGRARKSLNRFGRRWDDIHMGVLREEWEQLAAAKNSEEKST